LNFYKLYQGDCLNHLKDIENKSIDLVITDPPYNIGKDDWDNIDFYIEWIEQILNEVNRVMTDKASFWLFCSQLYYPEIVTLIKEKFIYRNTIIWRYFNGHVTQKGFSRRYEPLIYSVKSEEYVFDADSIRIPRKRSDNRYLKKYSKDGKVPDDVWDFNRVVYTPDRPDHPTIKPEAIIDRMIKVSSNKNDIILDPFLGSGTTMKVCQDLGRSCIGMELEPKYIDIIKQRCWGRQFLDRQVEYDFIPQLSVNTKQKRIKE